MLRLQELQDSKRELSDVEENLGKLDSITSFIKTRLLVIRSPLVTRHILDQIFKEIGLVV